MRRLLAVLAFALLALPSVAVAEDLRPTAAELQASRAVAVAYWHVQQPPCGRETVLTQTPLDSAAGMALGASCSIEFSSAMDWRDYPVQTCHTYVHEFGHLVLGVTYFAATNPGDPAHSLDAANVMYATPTWWQEEQESLTIGCLAPVTQATAHHRSHHRSKAARGRKLRRRHRAGRGSRRAA